MTISFFDATVGQFRQILPSAAGLIDKAETWCAAEGVDETTIIDDRLSPDMFTWAWQVRYSAIHSAGAIRSLLAGAFHPETDEPPRSLAALRAILTDAVAYLNTLDRDTIDAAQDKQLDFVYRGKRTPYRGSAFLLGFTMPNFYFHTAMAYAILRARGIDVGKRDFMGRVSQGL